MTNPKGAATLEKVESAIDDWDTNVRLFELAGGVAPERGSQRMSLISMLPLELSAHITMQLGNSKMDTYDKLKKYVLKYIKVIGNLKGRTKAAHMVDVQGETVADSESTLDDVNAEDPEYTELAERLVQVEDVDERIEILALMRSRQFKTPTRGQGGPGRQGPPVRFAPRNPATNGGRDPPALPQRYYVY